MPAQPTNTPKSPRELRDLAWGLVMVMLTIGGIFTASDMHAAAVGVAATAMAGVTACHVLANRREHNFDQAYA